MMKLLLEAEYPHTHTNSKVLSQNAFVTDETGFIGKLLTEKLLREYIDIRCIYFFYIRKKE
ncbi:fatty acyl-CoA reductase wat-like isoform X7 [Vespula squamosa]|uniref:Fatty acyl-CoA reductase wat-like isoform X7 n=1 Tax=Vespula squamosa TaxID=30214 RepID=A0ABD2BSH9_VESSQ